MSWRDWRRRTSRRVRRALGLTRLDRRTVLVLLLVFMGLAYVSVTVLAEFFAKLGRYAPQYYEPKDFSREPTQQLEKRNGGRGR